MRVESWKWESRGSKNCQWQPKPPCLDVMKTQYESGIGPNWIWQGDNMRRRSLLQGGCHQNLGEWASPSEELVWANGFVQSCCIASSATTKSKNCCWYFNCQHLLWRLVKHKKSWRANLRPALICSTTPPCCCKTWLMYTQPRQATQV